MTLFIKLINNIFNQFVWTTIEKNWVSYFDYVLIPCFSFLGPFKQGVKYELRKRINIRFT